MRQEHKGRNPYVLGKTLIGGNPYRLPEAERGKHKRTQTEQKTQGTPQGRTFDLGRMTSDDLTRMKAAELTQVTINTNKDRIPRNTQE